MNLGLIFFLCFSHVLVPLRLSHQLSLVIIRVESHPVQSYGSTEHGVSDPEALTDGQRLSSQLSAQICRAALDILNL